MNQAVDLLWSIYATQKDLEALRGTEIQHNEPAIWDDHLHRWDNQDWQGILDVLTKLKSSHSYAFSAADDAHIVKCKGILKRTRNPRVMDSDQNKTTAWKMIMICREVLDRIDPDLQPTPVYTCEHTFHDLFDIIEGDQQ